MAGALATTDAEGSDGSEAGVAKLAGAVAVGGGVASWGCLEHAASVKSNADAKRNGADFMSWLSKSSTVLTAVSTTCCPNVSHRRLSARIRRTTGQTGLAASRMSLCQERLCQPGRAGACLQVRGVREHFAPADWQPTHSTPARYERCTNRATTRRNRTHCTEWSAHQSANSSTASRDVLAGAAP